MTPYENEAINTGTNKLATMTDVYPISIQSVTMVYDDDTLKVRVKFKHCYCVTEKVPVKLTPEDHEYFKKNSTISLDTDKFANQLVSKVGGYFHKNCIMMPDQYAWFYARETFGARHDFERQNDGCCVIT